MKKVYKELYENAIKKGFHGVDAYLADSEKKSVREKLDKDFSRAFILGMPVFVAEKSAVPEQKKRGKK